jgi:hypothetical protein
MDRNNLSNFHGNSNMYKKFNFRKFLMGMIYSMLLNIYNTRYSIISSLLLLYWYIPGSRLCIVGKVLR